MSAHQADTLHRAMQQRQAAAAAREEPSGDYYYQAGGSQNDGNAQNGTPFLAVSALKRSPAARSKVAVNAAKHRQRLRVYQQSVTERNAKQAKKGSSRDGSSNNMQGREPSRLYGSQKKNMAELSAKMRQLDVLLRPADQTAPPSPPRQTRSPRKAGGHRTNTQRYLSATDDAAEHDDIDGGGGGAFTDEYAPVPRHGGVVVTGLTMQQRGSHGHRSPSHSPGHSPQRGAGGHRAGPVRYSAESEDDPYDTHEMEMGLEGQAPPLSNINNTHTNSSSSGKRASSGYGGVRAHTLQAYGDNTAAAAAASSSTGRAGRHTGTGMISSGAAAGATGTGVATGTAAGTAATGGGATGGGGRGSGRAGSAPPVASASSASSTAAARTGKKVKKTASVSGGLNTRARIPPIASSSTSGDRTRPPSGKGKKKKTNAVVPPVRIPSRGGSSSSLLGRGGLGALGDAKAPKIVDFRFDSSEEEEEEEEALVVPQGDAAEMLLPGTDSGELSEDGRPTAASPSTSSAATRVTPTSASSSSPISNSNGTGNGNGKKKGTVAKKKKAAGKKNSSSSNGNDEEEAPGLYLRMTTFSNIIRNVHKKAGFRVTKGMNFHSQWGKHMKSEMFRDVQAFQKVNHFPGSFQLGRKDRLYQNLSRMRRHNANSDFDFFPPTWLLPAESDELRKEMAARPGLYIVKPCASARGIGIKVISEFSQVPKKKSTLVQRYIADPFLIDGFKFDMRLYVLVTSMDPLRIYLYDDGLVRFCTERYRKNAKHASNRLMHLTNYSLQKHSDGFVENEDAEEDDIGNKWSIKALRRYFRENGIDDTEMWAQVKDIVIKTIISAEDAINTAMKMYVKHRNVCYECFGFDIMLDKNLKPWLIEVNVSPSLHGSSPLDKKIKTAMVTDMLHMLRFMSCDRNQFQKDEQKKRLARLQGLDGRPPSRANSARRRNVAELELGGLNDLSEDDLTVLQETQEEYARRGHFVRVYPDLDSDMYERYFKFPRYNNVLLFHALLKEHGLLKQPKTQRTARSAAGTSRSSAGTSRGRPPSAAHRL